MAYPRRITPGGWIFHVYNRANGRAKLFESSADYDEFVRLVARCAAMDQMRFLAWCIMPNHWHFLLSPRRDDDLTRFIQRLTIRHTKHWHIRNDSIGRGHFYQGRFKSSAVETDRYLLAVCRYIERNPVRANLVAHGADWRWSSARDRVEGASNGGRPSLPLEPLPVDTPSDWWRWLCEPEELGELDRLRTQLAAGVPVGSEAWAQEAASFLHVSDTPRKRGRPRKDHPMDLSNLEK